MENLNIVEQAIKEVQDENPEKIVRHYSGLIIVANNENDYLNKLSVIKSGDRRGFLSVKEILELDITQIKSLG